MRPNRYLHPSFAAASDQYWLTLARETRTIKHAEEEEEEENPLQKMTFPFSSLLHSLWGIVLFRRECATRLRSARRPPTKSMLAALPSHARLALTQTQVKLARPLESCESCYQFAS